MLIQFDHMPDPTARVLKKLKISKIFNKHFFKPNKPRDGKNIYELRSYKLKAGTIGEWHHNWANLGLRCRGHDEIVTGLFSNAGEL